jgi:hypothetical protein
MDPQHQQLGKAVCRKASVEKKTAESSHQQARRRPIRSAEQESVVRQTVT